MTISGKLRLFVLLSVLVCTVGCDQTSKHVARSSLGPFGTVALPGGLGELRLADNPGGFLSLGAALPPTFRIIVFTGLVGAGLCVLMIYLLKGKATDWMSFLGTTLIIGGGVSNLIDRIRYDGLVTDFIILRLGPLSTGVFNFADVLVMVGIGLLIWAWLKQPAKEKTA